jgi:hypothetical protein
VKTLRIACKCSDSVREAHLQVQSARLIHARSIAVQSPAITLLVVEDEEVVGLFLTEESAPNCRSFSPRGRMNIRSSERLPRIPRFVSLVNPSTHRACCCALKSSSGSGSYKLMPTETAP